MKRSFQSVVLTALLSFPQMGVPEQRRVYWTDHDVEKVQRKSLEGGPVETVLDLFATDWVSPHGITVDPVGRKMYWVDFNPGAVLRANLESPRSPEVFETNVANPRDITFIPEPSPTILLAGCACLLPVRGRTPNRGLSRMPLD